MIDYYGDNQDLIIANAGPGHWNDPDMVRKDEKLCLKFSKQGFKLCMTWAIPNYAILHFNLLRHLPVVSF